MTLDKSFFNKEASVSGVQEFLDVVVGGVKSG